MTVYGDPAAVGMSVDRLGRIASAMQQYVDRGVVRGISVPASTPNVFVRGGLGLFSTIDDYYRFAQMLANGGVLDGARIVGRKTLELMHTNRVPISLLPFEIMGMPSPGLGFGLGSRVMLDVAASNGPGSVGEFGWAGAAKTYFWIDPAEDLVGVFMSQYMTGPELPDRTFRAVVYQAIDD